MYCKDCGKKLEQTDIFCANCGSKIKKHKKTLIDIHSFTKKQKRFFYSLLFLLGIILIYIGINAFFFSEEAVIKKYMKAYVNNDYETVIELSDIKKNKFMTSNIIKEKYPSKTNETTNVRILTTTTKKEEHTRTISYEIKDSSNIVTLTIKRDGYKYFIFNNYKIVSSNLVAKNVQITVPEKTVLLIDGIELTKKDQVKKKDQLITYKIDNLLKKNVKITLKLENGIILTDTKSVFNNQNLDYSDIYFDTTDSSSKKKLESKIKESTTHIIMNALEEKEFIEITNINLYTDSLKNSTLFNNTYNTLKAKYSKKGVSDFKIIKTNIDAINLINQDQFSIKTTITYSYKDQTDRLHETSRVVTQIYNKDLLIDEFYLANLSYMF